MRLRMTALTIGVGTLSAGLLMAGSAQGAPFGSPVTTTDLQIAAVPGTVPAVIATIPVGEGPIGVAISQDDTVYVANLWDNTVSVINPGSLVEDDTIAVGLRPISVAVSNDGTVYVTASGDDAVSVINPGSLVEDDTIAVGDNPVGIAVSNDDTVYVTNNDDSTVSVINPGSLVEDDTIAVGLDPAGIAVTGDDTVYVANSSSGWVSVINPGSQIEDDSIYTGGLLRAVAVGGSNSVYVASYYKAALEVIRDGELDDSIAVGMNPVGVAADEFGRVFTANSTVGTVSVLTGDPLTQMAAVNVDDSPNGIAVNESTGLVYVTNENPGSTGTVSVIDLFVTPGLVDDTGGPVSSGQAGDAVTLDLSTSCAGDCLLVDDSTVQVISFDGVPVTDWERDLGVNSWSGPVPPGSGTVDVTVLFNGGQVASAGTFTYPALPPPPTPTPVNPPSVPTNVIGTAGDHSAALTWKAPTSTGSFPVTTYEVNSSPAASSCITSTLSCTVTGLTNDTAYTFSVRALNGAGWSPWSTPSEVVTPTAAPTPTLVIAGTRQDVRSKPGIRIIGTSTHLAAGTILRPWIRFPGQASFTQGTAQILVDTNGDFTWGRTTGKKTYVYLATPDDTLRSNRVTIPAA
jgi:YVTN family beta-propeller protein